MRRLWARLTVPALAGLVIVVVLAFVAAATALIAPSRPQVNRVLPEQALRVLQTRAEPTPEYRGTRGAVAFLVHRHDRHGRLFSMVVESEVEVTRHGNQPFIFEELTAVPLGEERYLLRFRQRESGIWTDVELIADLRLRTLDPVPGNPPPQWLNGFLTAGGGSSPRN